VYEKNCLKLNKVQQSGIVFVEISLVPLTSSWPHLRFDVGLEEGEYQ